MYDFTVKSPTEVYFGKTALQEMVNKLKGFEVKKVLLVYGGRSAEKFGHLKKIITLLNQNGMQTVNFGNNKQADWADLSEGIALAKSENVDAVIGLGGSIVMDSAKVIAFGAKNEHVWDYMNDAKLPAGLPVLPIIEIPTYPSGGSEADLAAEVYDHQKDTHGTLLGIFPDCAILDPTFSYSLTTYQTAQAGMVTFIQESLNYLGQGSLIANGFAKVILDVLVKSLRVLQSNPSDYDARGNMMWGATLTPQPIMNAGTDNDWTSFYGDVDYLQRWLNLPYRDAMILIFPNWLKMISKDNQPAVDKYLTKVLKTESGNIEAVRELFTEFGLKTKYTDEVTDAQWQRLDQLLSELPTEKQAAYKEMLTGCLK